MKLRIATASLVTGALAASWAAGGTALSYYLVSGGSSLWDGMIDKCQEFEDNGGVVRGINCVKNGVVYLVGAASAFGGGYAGAEYIKNAGVTNVGARSLPGPKEWNWPAIEAQPSSFVESLSSMLPGEYHDHAFNLTGHGIQDAVAVMNMDTDSMYAHVSNVTHGTLYMGTHKTASSDSDLERRSGRWNFGGWGGMKYSYSNPGCQGYSFSDAETTGYLETEVWNFVNWANAGHKGAKYSLEWDDENRYGTPYVGGYFVIEVNGFGTNFEGAPEIHDCLR